LDNFIKRKLNTTTDNSIKNTYDFINKINKINIIPGCKMISLDVKNLYTSIPKIDALNILKYKLTHSIFNNKEINEIIHSINIIVNQNYFEYDKKMYSQNDGFVMGSPLSAILSELYMQNYESINILNHKVYKQYIIAYFRYVDDTFILFKGTNRQAEVMVNNLNKINKNIQFTLETQIDNKINFLDLTINISNNKFNFNIYRKPTQTDTIIRNDSNHPFSQKYAYFNSILYRLERVPLNKYNYHNELNIICDIAIKNNFNINTIKKIHKKIKVKLKNPNYILPSNTINYCSMKYHNFLSGKFANILNKNKNNVKIAFKTKNNSIQTINNKSKKFTNKIFIDFD
jgi:hypothetical protein